MNPDKIPDEKVLERLYPRLEGHLTSMLHHGLIEEGTYTVGNVFPVWYCTSQALLRSEPKLKNAEFTRSWQIQIFRNNEPFGYARSTPLAPDQNFDAIQLGQFCAATMANEIDAAIRQVDEAIASSPQSLHEPKARILLVPGYVLTLLWLRHDSEVSYDKGEEKTRAKDWFCVINGISSHLDELRGSLVSLGTLQQNLRTIKPLTGQAAQKKKG